MFNLSFRSTLPLHEQITENYRRLIISGAISSGEKIPSVRELAAMLSVNPNTIQKAYRALESDGYIYTVSGKGSYVGNTEKLKEKNTAIIMRQFDVLVTDIFSMGITGEQLKARIDSLKEAC